MQLMIPEWLSDLWALKRKAASQRFCVQRGITYPQWPARCELILCGSDVREPVSSQFPFDCAPEEGNSLQCVTNKSESF